MKNWFFPLVIAVMLGLWGCSDQTTSGVAVAQSSGIVAVDQPSANLGVLPPNATASASFAIQNVSDAPVKLVLVQSSCSCLEVTVPDAEVAPGNAGLVTVSATVERRADVPELGLLIRASTPDGRRQDMVLSLSYQPDLEYEVWPNSLLIVCREGEEATAAIYIRPAADENVKIVSAEVERLPGARVERIDSYPTVSGEGYVIRLAFEGVEQGRFLGGVRCVTSNETHPEFGVYISLRIDPPLKMEPPGFVLSPEAPERSVRVSGNVPTTAELEEPIEGLAISSHTDGSSLIVTAQMDFGTTAAPSGSTSVALRGPDGAIIDRIRLVWLSR